MMDGSLPGCWVDNAARDFARKAFGSPTPATWITRVKMLEKAIK